MRVRKFSIEDADFELSPGQDAQIFTGDLVNASDGAPITIGYGRYSPDQTLNDVIAVDDVMIVLEGRLSVSSEGRLVEAGPGEIVHLAKGNAVTIRSHADGALTAYVTYPHWRDAAGV